MSGRIARDGMQITAAARGIAEAIRDDAQRNLPPYGLEPMRHEPIARSAPIAQALKPIAMHVSESNGQADTGGQKKSDTFWRLRDRVEKTYAVASARVLAAWEALWS